MKAIILLLLLFFFLRFIYRYILPAVRVVRTARKGLQQMQQGFGAAQQQPYQQPAQPVSNAPGFAKKQGDYIDYEEVK